MWRGLWGGGALARPRPPALCFRASVARGSQSWGHSHSPLGGGREWASLWRGGSLAVGGCGTRPSKVPRSVPGRPSCARGPAAAVSGSRWPSGHGAGGGGTGGAGKAGTAIPSTRRASCYHAHLHTGVGDFVVGGGGDTALSRLRLTVVRRQTVCVPRL